jgi:hypothetical protein
MNERMLRLLVVASIVGVFLGGLVIGYGLGVRRAAEPPASGPAGGPPRLEELLDRFTARLGISPAQRDRIEQHLRDGERKLRETMTRVRPELESHREQIERAILDELTAEQRVKYHEILPHGLPRPPPHRPPPPG